LGLGRSRVPRQGFGWWGDTVAKRFDLRNEIGGDVLSHAAFGDRFGGIVTGAERQGVQRGNRSPFGKRAEHDDRKFFVNFADCGKCFQAIHYRHLDIENDGVRVQLRNFREANFTVRGRANHLDLRVAGEVDRQEAANDH